MTKQIQGILLNPLGVPLADAGIRYTSLTTVGDTPENSEAIFETEFDGSYDFLLSFGHYQMEINYDDEYHLIGNVIVEEETPEPITLQDLLEYSTEVNPPVVVPDSPIWETLHDDLRNGVATTERTKVDQLSDDQTYTNETKKLIQNPTISAEMAEESVMTNVGTARLDDQTNVYQDSNNHQSIQKTSNASTETASFNLSAELYEASNGIVEGYLESDITTPIGSYNKLTTLDENIVGYVESLNINSGALTISNTLEDTEHNHSTVVSLDDGVSVVSSDHSKLMETSDDVNGEPKIEIINDVGFTRAGAVTHTVDMKHSQLAYVDGLDQTQAYQEFSITGSGKGMGIYQTLDGIHQTQIIKSDFNTFVGSDDVPVLEVDAINNEVTIHGRLIVTNPEDFVGTPGASYYFEYQYSQDNGVSDPWHTTPDYNVDYWRRQREVTNPNDGSSLIYGDWSEGFLLNAADGLPGDALWIDYEYGAGTDTVPPSTLDPSWTDTMEDGDIWRRERTVTNGVPGDWSTPARIKGLNGLDPEVVMIEYQYAIDGLSTGAAWHYNFETGDHYRRERILYFRTPEDLAAYVPVSNDTSYNQSPWNNVAQIVPINGIDYGNKQSTIYIYQRNASGTVAPADPSGDLTWNFDNLTLTPSGNLNGWSTTIPSAGGDYLWIGVAVATTQGSEDSIAPAEWDYALWSEKGSNGTNGFTPVVVSLYCVTASGVTPTKTFSSVTYYISNGSVSISGSNPYGWSGTVPSNVAEGGQVWIITDAQLAAATATITYHYPSYFSNPVVMSRNGVDGQDGQDGVDGIQGSHGSGSYIVQTTASKATVQGYSNNTRTSHFTSLASRPPQEGDILGYSNSSTTSGFRLDYLFDGSSWGVFTNVIDGSVIVHGTVASESLVTGLIIADDATINGKIDVTEFTAGGGGGAVQLQIYDNNYTDALRIRVNNATAFYMGTDGVANFSGFNNPHTTLVISQGSTFAIDCGGKSRINSLDTNYSTYNEIKQGTDFMTGFSDANSIACSFYNRQAWFEKEIQAPLGVSPFTGSHLFVVATGLNLSIGSLVCDGDLVSIGGGVSNALFTAEHTTMPRCKAAVGVIASQDSIENPSTDGDSVNYNKFNKTLIAHGVTEEWCEANKDVYETLSVNSVGEGLMLVCNDGGNIEKGDLLCSSSVAGHAMKQVDVNNVYIMNDVDFTVGKSRVDVDWSTEPETTKLIPVFYRGG